MSEEVAKVDWSIKEYVHFKIRPSLSIPMFLEYEVNNPKDTNAILVKMPPISSIDRSKHNVTTREKKGSRPAQYVHEIAGKTVGRVPANLCRALRKISDQNHLSKPIIVEYKGELNPSSQPPKYQRFKRSSNGGKDRAGGGMDLKCCYVLNIKNGSLEKCINVFKECLSTQNMSNIKYDIKKDENI